MNKDVVNKLILIIIVVIISVLFLTLIKNFVMVLILSAIFSALFQRVYKHFFKWFNNQNIASLITLLLIFLIIILPLLGFLGIVASQAFKISNVVKPWLEEQLASPNYTNELIQKLPYSETILSHREEILQKAGDLVGTIGNYVFEQASTATRSTVNFLLLAFVFFYSMFFFLKDGNKILHKILDYFPMKEEEELRLLNRFTSVTRATLKGTLLIGVIQGAFAGLAFWIAGIDSVLFWTVIMMILSIIPVIGSALIWLPATIFLFVSGKYANAVFLMLFCGIVVGSIDNFLRPKFVGRDTKLHELMILLSTLGGISLFGIVGFIIGPIIAALFVTVWDIYANTFKESLLKSSITQKEITYKKDRTSKKEKEQENSSAKNI